MELPAWLTPDTVTIEPYAGAGAGGQPVYGPPRTSRARVEYGTRVVRVVSGAQVIVAGSVFLPLDQWPVPPESRITLPDRVAHVVTATRHEFGPETPNHVEVTVR